MPAASDGCVFCEIAAGRAPASMVHSDDTVIAFLDIRPVNAGHLLVVPREHAAGLSDLDPAAGSAVFAVAQRLAGALRTCGVPCEGVNLFLADGEVTGQEVPHVHLHVLPRWFGDSNFMTVVGESRVLPEDLHTTYQRMRAALTLGKTGEPR
jgi:diadenosine tetraphosphate (Ap4A) HIT family hydrolase